MENNPERFKIIPANEQSPKKRFEIMSNKKAFEVISESPAAPEKLWFKQENANDCGPCMILNTLHKLGIHTAHSIEEVRRQVNELRQQSNRRQLGANDWLTSEDVGEYFSKIAGLSVEEYPCFKDSQNEVVQAIENNLAAEAYDIIYTTNGRHFRGIVNKEGETILLDSFQDAPRNVDAAQMNEQISQNIFSDRGDAPDRVGIVRRNKGASYRTIAL